MQGTPRRMLRQKLGLELFILHSEIRGAPEGIAKRQMIPKVRRIGLGDGQVVRSQTAIPAPEPMPLRDVVFGPVLKTQALQHGHAFQGAIQISDGHEDIQNGFGSQPGDRRTADVVDGDDPSPKFAQESGP